MNLSAVADTITGIDLAPQTPSELHRTGIPVPELDAAMELFHQGRFDEAEPELRRFAKSGHISAMYLLATMFIEGKGVDRSIDDAVRVLKPAVEAKHPDSMQLMAQLVAKDSPEAALRLYRDASRAGNQLAALKMGVISEEGLLTSEPSTSNAFEYYRAAHRGGVPMGTFRLALCYDQGIGTAADPSQAIRLFRKAALSGVQPANTEVARCYFDGRGVEADSIAAIGWLTRGIEAGATSSLVMMGSQLELGETITQNYSAAAEHYRRAAEAGDDAGCFHLAMMYREGKGTDRDPIRAYQLLTRAKNHEPAIEALASLEIELTPKQKQAAIEAMANASQ